jgi:hypothetical protein
MLRKQRRIKYPKVLGQFVCVLKSEYADREIFAAIIRTATGGNGRVSKFRFVFARYASLA